MAIQVFSLNILSVPHEKPLVYNMILDNQGPTSERRENNTYLGLWEKRTETI